MRMSHALGATRSRGAWCRETLAPRRVVRTRPTVEGDRVLNKLRQRLTYANVMSTLAVFIALGGSSYAAVHDQRQQHQEPLDRRRRSSSATRSTGREIRESRLAPGADARGTPTASAAYRPPNFKIRCPSDTFPIADVCVERTPRPATSYGSAVLHVRSGRHAGGARPAAADARRAQSRAHGGAACPGGELTSNVYPSGTDPGRLDVLYVTDQVGGVALTPDTAAGSQGVPLRDRPTQLKRAA